MKAWADLQRPLAIGTGQGPNSHTHIAFANSEQMPSN